MNEPINSSVGDFCFQFNMKPLALYVHVLLGAPGGSPPMSLADVYAADRIARRDVF